MARSDKDNAAKEAALKFCTSAGLVPFLEVEVLTGMEFSPTPKLLTDIDVLGTMLLEDGSYTRTIFDCKSTGGPAFARAMWLSGLMSFVSANHGMILMGKPAERAHRLAARQLNVQLFGSNSFDSYAIASNPEFAVLHSYSGNLENWHRVADASKAQPAISSIYAALKQEVPLTREAPKSFRRLISRILEHKGELNPAKPLHMAAFTEVTMCFSLLLNMMVGDLRNLVDLTDGEKDFTSVLRYYLWGGHEGVTTLIKMYNLMGGADKDGEAEKSLVSWPQFVQLVRGLLEAPTQIRHSTLALRELSLRYLADKDAAADKRAGKLFASPRARQFSKRFGSYTASILKVSPEFSERLDLEIDQLTGSYSG